MEQESKGASGAAANLGAARRMRTAKGQFAPATVRAAGASAANGAAHPISSPDADLDIPVQQRTTAVSIASAEDGCRGSDRDRVTLPT